MAHKIENLGMPYNGSYTLVSSNGSEEYLELNIIIDGEISKSGLDKLEEDYGSSIKIPNDKNMIITFYLINQTIKNKYIGLIIIVKVKRVGYKNEKALLKNRMLSYNYRSVLAYTSIFIISHNLKIPIQVVFKLC